MFTQAVRRPSRAVPVALAFSALLLAAAHAGAAVVTYQQGVAGYNQGNDTVLFKSNPNTPFPGNLTLSARDLGGPNESHALLQFGGIFGNGSGQIPLGATINSATLTVFNAGGAVPLTGALHRLLVSFNEATDTFNSWNGGANNVPAGEYDPVPSYSGSVAVGPFSVSSIVQAWSAGAPNHGIAFIPTSGGGVSFHSNDGSNASLRPILSVNYVPIPEPSTLALFSAATLLMFRRARNQTNR